MAIRDIFKVSRKTFINPSSWLDYDSLKLQNKTIWTILKNVFTTPLPAREETFEAAMERLGLTDDDILQAVKRYQMYMFFFLFLSFLSLVYTFYLFIHQGSFAGGLLGIATSALFFTQVFKYHFWVFQMKRRQLGASFADWRRHLFGGSRSS